MRVLQIASILVVLHACNCNQDITTSKLDAFYTAAIQDAMKMEPGEFYEGIRTVTGDSVVVVTWVSEDKLKYYKSNLENDTAKSIKGFDAWVTIVPDVIDYCVARKFGKTDSASLRLRQLLGLPPDNQNTHFVELKVRTRDLYRPTPDPKTESVAGFLQDNEVKGDSCYRNWYQANLNSSFMGRDKFPWNRLGYSYDWGNPYSEIGLSEFVIPGEMASADFNVRVLGIYNTEQYCVLGSLTNRVFV